MQIRRRFSKTISGLVIMETTYNDKIAPKKHHPIWLACFCILSYLF